MATLGAAFGSVVGGPSSDKLGRKPTILIADILFVAGAVVMGTAPTIAVLILGRILVGVSPYNHEFKTI
jgi:SP family myo-inositol transporter-like MFS transporter 13